MKKILCSHCKRHIYNMKEVEFPLDYSKMIPAANHIRKVRKEIPICPYCNQEFQVIENLGTFNAVFFNNYPVLVMDESGKVRIIRKDKDSKVNIEKEKPAEIEKKARKSERIILKGQRITPDDEKFRGLIFDV